MKENLSAEFIAALRAAEHFPQATEVVQGNVQGGADLTKLFTGSWVERGKVLPMPEETATAAAAETHRHHKLVFTHPSSVAGLEVALRARVDVLAHALDDLRGLTPEHLRRMKAQDMALIPTLNLWGGDQGLFEILDEVHDYARLGGVILFGTDVGYLPDYDPVTEYVLMQSAGLGWREILASLTTAPAARFGEASRRGRIAPGMDADLVVPGSRPGHRCPGVYQRPLCGAGRAGDLFVFTVKAGAVPGWPDTSAPPFRRLGRCPAEGLRGGIECRLHPLPAAANCIRSSRPSSLVLSASRVSELFLACVAAISGISTAPRRLRKVGFAMVGSNGLP